jgi:hypothetical protein
VTLGDLGWNWVKPGVGAGGEIAVIADIARHRRDRKSNTLPLINADDRGSENAETYAKLG